MPAKAIVPVEALPCITRFRGHGPLLQERRFDHGTVTNGIRARMIPVFRASAGEPRLRS
jgi:hypothetical protein